jgi:hypothetical protein
MEMPFFTDLKMALKSVFITGCNRGIGLELGRLKFFYVPTERRVVEYNNVHLFISVKQYAALENGPQHIFATYRKMSGKHFI